MLVLKDCAVYGCSDNCVGELGNPTTITTDVPIQILPASDSIVEIAAGEDSGYALSSNGSLWVWGLTQAANWESATPWSKHHPFNSSRPPAIVSPR
jgi:alpha-tubulin suppressor-like RCC1 family protein